MSRLNHPAPAACRVGSPQAPPRAPQAWRVALFFLLMSLVLGVLTLPALARDPAASSDPPTAEEMAGLIDRPENLVAWRELAERVLARDPESYAGQILMGFVLHRSEGDLPRARFHLEKGRKLALRASDRGVSEAFHFYALALFELRLVLAEMDRYQDQLTILEEFARLRGGPVVAAEFAWPLMKLDREIEAREKLSQAFGSGDPVARIVAWNSLGALEMEYGNAQASYNAFQSLLAEAHQNNWPLDCTYLRNAGEAALALGKYDEAERYFREATSVPFNDQTFSNPYLDLAGLYLTQARFPEALEATRRMHQWARAIKPFLYQQSMADTQQMTGELLLELGYVEEGLEQLDMLVQRPDRRGGTSGTKDQAEAGNLVVWRSALLAWRERLAERMASARGLEWWRLAFQRLQLGLKARAAGRRVAALAVANDRIQGSLRPYWAGSISMGEWFRPDLVELYGPGVTAAALQELRQNPPEKLPLEEPFLEAIDAEVAALSGDRSTALQHLERALSSLPESESLLRARLHARTGQLLEDRGDRPQALTHFQMAMQKAPGMLRTVRARLPVTLQGDSNPTMREVARSLGRSPRFRSVGDGLPLQLSLAGDRLEALLLGTDGSVLARGVAPLQQDLHQTAADLVEDLHRQAFSPQIDLSQVDLNSLDGSNASGSTASQKFREIFRTPGPHTRHFHPRDRVARIEDSRAMAQIP